MNHLQYCAQFVPPHGRVLDVGSGKGKFICGMAGLKYEAFGVEINPEYVTASKIRATQEGVRVSLQIGMAERLPFEDNYFAFVNCSEVTEHVEEPKAVLQEIYRVLAPGGRVYISFHNRFGIYDYHYHLFGINWLPRNVADWLLNKVGKGKSDGEAGRQTLTGMHYYTYAGAVKLLKNVGFTIEDIRETKLRKKFSTMQILLIGIYKFFARPVYFNTFHFLAQKPYYK
jgi:ubiquinone/menaquinone biosynthesis C-methylase UbiE